MRKDIVVGYDGSPASRAALAWALEEASRSTAAVELLYADEWPIWAPAASMVPSPALRPETYTDQVIGGMMRAAVDTVKQSHPLIPITYAIVQALPSTALIGRSGDARLVVLGSHGHSGVAGLFGSVGSAVTARARCPVVVVRGDAPAGAPVVAGVDGSALASGVLGFAAAQAAARKTTLRVIRAWPPVAGLWAGSPLATYQSLEFEREPFDTLITLVRDEFPELRIQAEALVEHPAAALTRASGAAQLVVVGGRGHGAVRGLLLGSVSQHLLRHAACPVAVVHDLVTTA